MQSKKNPKKLNNFYKYSSLAFEMFAIMLVSVFGGIKLDAWLNTQAVFTIILTILGVVWAIYYAIKGLLK